MNKILFEGISVALVTPFKNGAVDYDALENIINFQNKGGIGAFIILGTTAEASTLSIVEQNEIIAFTRKVINGRAKIIVGTGSNCTATAVQRAQEVKAMDVDGLLVVTPYYNKCTQAGLVAHYNQIANAVKMPIIAYNVPQRTGVSINVQTAVELSENPHIVGLKEASGNISHIMELSLALENKMAIYSGDDELDYLFYTLGAHGSISVTANIMPKQKIELFNLVRGLPRSARRQDEALVLHNQLLGINGKLFCEVNPIPVKAALHHLGLCTDEMRMPLTTIEEPNRRMLVETLRRTQECFTTT